VAETYEADYGVVSFSVVRGEYSLEGDEHVREFAVALRSASVTTDRAGNVYRGALSDADAAVRAALLDGTARWWRVDNGGGTPVAIAAYRAGPHGGPVVDGVELHEGAPP
jgi:hypothetical protein